MRERGTRAAYLEYCLSMLIFGSIGVFRRWIPLGSAQLAFFRGCAGALFLLAWKLLRGKKSARRVTKKELGFLILTGAVIGLNWILLFEAYNDTSVPVATLCYYMQPTVVLLLAPAVLGERLTLRKGLCALAAAAGMVLVSGVTGGGGTEKRELLGIVFGLGAAVLYAGVILLNKKFLTGVDALDKSILQLASAAAVLLPYLPFTGRPDLTLFDARAWILLAVVGLVHTGGAYALFFAGMTGLRAQSAAVLGYIDPVFALLLAALALGEKLSLAGGAGAVLIIGAAILAETEKTPREEKTQGGNSGGSDG